MKKKIKVGAITIGQAPRVDITGDIRPMLAPHIELMEYGALDPYEFEEASRRFAPKEGESVLVSRMRDGRQVTMSEEAVIPLVQDCINRSEKEGAEATVLLCTGKFPEFSHSRLLITPQPILHALVQKLALDKPIGLFVPDSSQVAQVEAWFAASGIRFEPVIASPYKDASVMGQRARGLKGRDLAFVLLDCMGYGLQMKEDIRESCGLPVILPRTYIARLLNELFD